MMFHFKDVANQNPVSGFGPPKIRKHAGKNVFL